MTLIEILPESFPYSVKCPECIEHDEEGLMKRNDAKCEYSCQNCWFTAPLDLAEDRPELVVHDSKEEIY